MLTSVKNVWPVPISAHKMLFILKAKEAQNDGLTRQFLCKKSLPPTIGGNNKNQ